MTQSRNFCVLLEAPSDCMEKLQEDNYLNLVDQSSLCRTNKELNRLFKAKISAAHLLQHVARGQQDAAEALLQQNSELLVEKVQVTDYSGRTFKNITAFQYALWALDNDMWQMILKYLTADQAFAQLSEHESKKMEYTTAHGIHYDFKKLLDVLKIYIERYLDLDSSQRRAYWGKEVGGEQRLMPAHVMQEYCRPDISFYDRDWSDNKKLLRTTKIKSSGSYNLEIYPLYPNKGLGFHFGLHRGEEDRAATVGGVSVTAGGVFSSTWRTFIIKQKAEIDFSALTGLFKMRIDQYNDFKTSMLKYTKKQMR